jgi:hypothetical protein
MLLGSSGGNGSCDPLAMTADHLRPVRDGGQTPGNIVAACYECNQARGQVTNRTRIRTEYDLASTAAVGKLIPLQLEFPSDAWMAWMKAAMHRWKRDGAA